MTDIEQKALALVDEVRAERGYSDVQTYPADRKFPPFEALCRAIEAHEADKARHAAEMGALRGEVARLGEALERIAAFNAGTWPSWEMAATARAALAARGLKLVKKEPSQ